MFFLRDEIQIPKAYQEAIASFYWDTPAPSQKEMSRDSSRLQKLWTSLAVRRGQSSSGQETRDHYSFDKDSVRLYGSYYLLSNFLKPAAVLEEMLLLGNDPGGDSLRVLDIGCGPGTALWGLSWWAGERGKKLEYLGLDRSHNFVKEAAELAGALPERVVSHFKALKKTTAETLFDEVAQFNPHVVLFMNCIAEIESDVQKRQQVLSDFVKRCRSGLKHPPVVIVIEPGSMDSTRELLSWRDKLIVENAAQILLPCLDARGCGALSNPKDWCHEEIAVDFPQWHSDLGRLAGLKKESMLFSYLVLNLSESKRSLPKQASRVVSQRLEEKGLMKCWVCMPEGCKKTVRVMTAKSKLTPQNEGFLDIGRGSIFTRLSLDEKSTVVEFEEVVAETVTVFQQLR